MLTLPAASSLVKHSQGATCWSLLVFSHSSERTGSAGEGHVVHEDVTATKCMYEHNCRKSSLSKGSPTKAALSDVQSNRMLDAPQGEIYGDLQHIAQC